jgi:hypothetical protein
MEHNVVTEVARSFIGWKIIYSPPGMVPLTVAVWFWRRRNAEQVAMAMNAAFFDGTSECLREMRRKQQFRETEKALIRMSAQVAKEKHGG